MSRPDLPRKVVDGRRRGFHAQNRPNLTQDPSEQTNVLAREGPTARRLSAQLERWRIQCGAIMPTRNPNADPAWPGWNLTGAEKPTPPAQ